ncbi:MAG: AzlC family ABC transporter permease [Gammaproteobacteria bacterium]|nr:AzlC family ABC transporter permease [Gammaproteobacteria bacterium]
MIRAALKTTLPIFFGYLPLGIAFGLLFQELGYPWYFATLMGVCIYAGAAQFMAVGLLATGVGFVEIAIATFFLNSRHIFYGLALLNGFGHWGFRKLYLIFGLTDEVYSLMTTIEVPQQYEQSKFYFWMTLFSQSYWIIGCTLGAWAGTQLALNTQGMEFAATALFTVLLIEQWIKVRKPLPFVVALIASAIALLLLAEHMLILAISLSLMMMMALRLTNQKVRDEY